MPKMKTAPETKTEKQILLEEITAFAERSGLSEASVGRYAIEDSKVAARLRAGGNIDLDKAAALRKWMREWQPKSRKRRSTS